MPSAPVSAPPTVGEPPPTFVVPLRHDDKGDTGAGKNVDDVRRSGSFGRNNQRRRKRQHAFSGQRAHIADIRPVADGGGKRAGLIDGDDLLAVSEGEHDLRHRGADGDDARRVANLDLAAVPAGDRARLGCLRSAWQICENERRGDKLRKSAHSFAHFVRINLFCAVSRRR